MNKDVVSVTSEGQLTLPEKIRKELRIEKFNYPVEELEEDVENIGKAIEGKE